MCLCLTLLACLYLISHYLSGVQRCVSRTSRVSSYQVSRSCLCLNVRVEIITIYTCGRDYSSLVRQKPGLEILFSVVLSGFNVCPEQIVLVLSSSADLYFSGILFAKDVMFFKSLLCWFQQEEEEEFEVVYSTPRQIENAYLMETFDDIAAFESTWVKSKARKEGVDDDIAKYDG